MNTEILFCPHCSSTTAPRITIIEGKDSFRHRYAVLCDYESGGCGAEGGYRHSEEEAIAVWNERSLIPVPTNTARKVKTVTISYDIEVYEDDIEEDIRNDVYCTLQTLEYRKVPHTLHIEVKDKVNDSLYNNEQEPTNRRSCRNCQHFSHLGEEKYFCMAKGTTYEFEYVICSSFRARGDTNGIEF